MASCSTKASVDSVHKQVGCISVKFYTNKQQAILGLLMYFIDSCVHGIKNCSLTQQMESEVVDVECRFDQRVFME